MAVGWGGLYWVGLASHCLFESVKLVARRINPRIDAECVHANGGYVVPPMLWNEEELSRGKVDLKRACAAYPWSTSSYTWSSSSYTWPRLLAA